MVWTGVIGEAEYLELKIDTHVTSDVAGNVRE